MSEEKKTFLEVMISWIGVKFTSIILVICVFTILVCLFNILRKDKNKQKKPYKTLGIFSLIAILDIPLLINELYKHGLNIENTYTTMWGAEAVLSFYGAFLAFIGTTTLGIITIIQNNRATDISKKAYNDTKIAQLPLFEATNNFTLADNPLHNIKTEGWKVGENYGADICFTMQNDSGKLFQVGYFIFKLKNICNFPVKRIRINKINVHTIGEIDFVVLTPTFGDNCSIEGNKDKTVCIKMLSNTANFYISDSDKVQLTIYFQCYTQENRLVEFSLTILKHENNYTVLEPSQSKYKEEK